MTAPIVMLLAADQPRLFSECRAGGRRAGAVAQLELLGRHVILARCCAPGHRAPWPIIMTLVVWTMI
jgi:hypothetical protein